MHIDVVPSGAREVTNQLAARKGHFIRLESTKPPPERRSEQKEADRIQKIWLNEREASTRIN
jgi:hypothetical protein